MNATRRALILALLPFALGLAAALLLRAISDGLPIVRLRADLGSWLALLCGLLSLVVLTGVAVWAAARRRLDQALTEARQAQAEAHRRFLRQLDHELKNPLTAIRVGLANLAGTPPGEARARTLTGVATQVSRLNKLATDLRKLADLETQPLERAAVDLNELLSELVTLAKQRPESEEREIALTLPQAPWPLPQIPGDRDLLFLAVYNLLDNALKFTRPDDTIEVRAVENGRVVTVEVADTGPGIPEDELSHVFEELYRGQGARGTEGSGLGLALVRAIVERHGGTVTVRSREGEGTVFTLHLPLN
jgi:two-component system OmpR family sensor kinase